LQKCRIDLQRRRKCAWQRRLQHLACKLNRSKKMEKVEKNGFVAVLYSPGYGAGWSTWGDKNLAMDARIVKAFIDGGVPAVIEAVNAIYPNSYTGGADYLKIEWVKKGRAFTIDEYDGFESIAYADDTNYFVA
jgi:hypothetical protein